LKTSVHRYRHPESPDLATALHRCRHSARSTVYYWRKTARGRRVCHQLHPGTGNVDNAICGICFLVSEPGCSQYTGG
jgi:hypothetical protein